MVRILTDTASDITPSEAWERDIQLAELDVRFAEEAYDASADAGFRAFYRRLESGKVFPKTSQPPPEDFESAFEKAREAGDSVVAVLVSSGLSGTYQTAEMVRQAGGYADVHLVDSRTAIMSQRILTEHALRLRDEGLDAASIAEALRTLVPRVQVFGMLDTLTYLYRGGRLSRTASLAGNLLHIRPVITARDGVIAMVGRGRKYQAILKYLDEYGYDPSFPVYLGYTADASRAETLEKLLLEKHPDIRHTGIYPIGPVIGAHVGPNGVGIAFVMPNAGE